MITRENTKRKLLKKVLIFELMLCILVAFVIIFLYIIKDDKKTTIKSTTREIQPKTSDHTPPKLTYRRTTTPELSTSESSTSRTTTTLKLPTPDFETPEEVHMETQENISPGVTPLSPIKQKTPPKSRSPIRQKTPPSHKPILTEEPYVSPKQVSTPPKLRKPIHHPIAKPSLQQTSMFLPNPTQKGLPATKPGPPTVGLSLPAANPNRPKLPAVKPSLRYNPLGTKPLGAIASLAKYTEAAKPPPANPNDLFIRDNFIKTAKTIESLFRQFKHGKIQEYMLKLGYERVYNTEKTKIYISDKYCLKINTPMELNGGTECDIMKDLDHPNVIKMHHHYSFEAGLRRKLIVVMLTEKLEKIDESKYSGDYYAIQRIAKDILNGLVYLQSRRIIHNDLKLANLMQKKVDGKYVTKIIDFDIAVVARTGTLVVRFAPIWLMPPELLMDKRVGMTSDIWHLGLHVICPLIWPEKRKSEKTTMYSNNVYDYFGNRLNNRSNYIKRAKFRYAKPEKPNPLIENFLDCCLEIDETKRWRPEMLLRHKFITEVE
ncbi:MKCC [Enterospora canceri]|uniref:MKCC n=1 Tax=Enterospora canceri TaxID=1081671 RepID=A0A1Y1S914_9MICR|nr:MKCC [Enterospora canceri]